MSDVAAAAIEAEGTGASSASTGKRPADSHSPPAAKKTKKKHMDPQVLATRGKIQMCCKTNDLATALETYRAALAENIRVEPQVFYSLLNLCDGLDRKVHIGTPKPTDETVAELSSNGSSSNGEPTHIRPVDLQARKEAAFQIRQQMARQSIPLNETAYSALVKILSRAKEVELADTILAEAEGVSQCRVKLRLYSSLLVAYCEMGRLLPALKLWERLSQRELALSEKEYAAILDCCAQVGAGSVMQKVLSDLSEDVLVPGRETCHAVIKWFESPFATGDPVNGKSHDDQDPLESIEAVLARIPLPPNQTLPVEPIGPVHSPSNWTISPDVKVDAKTGTLLEGCLKGETLRPVQLSAKAWEEMLQLNETIVMSGKLDQDMSKFQGGKKGRKRQFSDREMEVRKRSWLDFAGYLKHQQQLRQRENHSTTFDVVMDGANIGYFQQNYSGAPKHVDYDQIDTVVRHFQKQGKRILLVMHERHFAPTLMPRRLQPLVQSWERAGILCRTPAGMNDDWFWMQAALVSGPGTLVVTNDEMRDHFFQMLAPRSFLRWKERNQVHFHFGGGAPDGESRGSGRRPVVLTFPEIYSRRIQRVADGYAIPHPKQGDENRFLDGSHFVDDTAAKEETYLCIRPTVVGGQS